MIETIAAYTARIYGFVEGKDPLTVQSQSVSTLAELISGLSEESLMRNPAPGKWSMCEILAHLADTEVVSTWRYRQMIEKTGVPIAAFDQNEWVRVGDYRSINSQDSLSLFRLLRDNNLRMFSRLTPEEWQNFGVHAERGRMTVQDLVRQMAGHDLNHIDQIRQIAALK